MNSLMNLITNFFNDNIVIFALVVQWQYDQLDEFTHEFNSKEQLRQTVQMTL